MSIYIFKMQLQNGISKSFKLCIIRLLLYLNCMFLHVHKLNSWLFKLKMSIIGKSENKSTYKTSLWIPRSVTVAWNMAQFWTCRIFAYILLKLRATFLFASAMRISLRKYSAWKASEITFFSCEFYFLLLWTVVVGYKSVDCFEGRVFIANPLRSCVESVYWRRFGVKNDKFHYKQFKSFYKNKK